jgi:hypothetical protein
MGMGWETVGAWVSDAAAASAQGMAALANQSLTVRATAGGSAPVTLESIFTDFQAAGDLRIRSPRLHDDVNAIRVAAPAGVKQVAVDRYFEQPLFSQDTLTVEAVFTTAPTAGDYSLGFLQIAYDDVPGIAGNFRTWAEVSGQIVDYLAVPVNPSSAAALGSWGGGVAINSTVDVFKANTLYALLGYIAPVAFGAFSIQGVDVGNLQFGGPGSTDTKTTRGYFADLSQNSGKPAIPVVNSQNKNTTLVSVADGALSTAYELSLVWAQLSA